jgi:hypothetical protein
VGYCDICIENESQDDYVTKNEAFCQVPAEIPLDTGPTANSFLPAAVEFCNKKLLGTLVSTISIDGDTQKARVDVLSKSIDDLKYGAIAINGAVVNAFFSLFLNWSGTRNEEEYHIESGRGNFGNLLGFHNVEKVHHV